MHESYYIAHPSKLFTYEVNRKALNGHFSHVSS